MIAKALLHRPKLLFLDEPTAGVDVDLRQALWDLILALHEEGTTILLTTHYLEEAEKLCHRIGVIGAGRLLCLDTTQSLIERLTHRKIHLVLKKQKQPLQSPYLVEQRGVNITLDVPKGTDLSRMFQESGLTLEDIHDLTITEGTLEEAFRNILGGNP